MWNNDNNSRTTGGNIGTTRQTSEMSAAAAGGGERSRAAPKLVDYFYELQRRTALTATVPPLLTQQQRQNSPHASNEQQQQPDGNNNNNNSSSIFNDKAYGQANTERILNWMENETRCLRDESGGSSCGRQDDENFPECPDGEHLEKKESITKTNKAEFLVKSKAMALRNVEKLLNTSNLSDTKSEKKSDKPTADNYDKNPTEEPLIVDTCNTGSQIAILDNNNNNIKNENLRAQTEPNTSENKLNIDLDGCTLLDMANITPKTHEYDPTTTESFTVLSSEDEKHNNSNKFINDENAMKSKNKHSIRKNDLKTKTASKSKRVRNSLNSIKLSPLLSISDQNMQRLVVNSKRDYLAVTRTRVIKVPKPSPWEEHITKVLEKRDLKKLKSKSFI
ncbi:MAG: hypothetical protein MHMPM18_000107 [Marteilia pararefringens]